MFVDFRERDKRREREKIEGQREGNVGEKHLSVASRMFNIRGSNPQPRYVP